MTTTLDTLTTTPATVPAWAIDGRNRGAEWIVTPQGWAAPNPLCEAEPDSRGYITVEVPTRQHTRHGYFRGMGEPTRVTVVADELRDLHEDVRICADCGDVAEMVDCGGGRDCADCHRSTCTQGCDAPDADPDAARDRMLDR